MHKNVRKLCVCVYLTKSACFLCGLLKCSNWLKFLREKKKKEKKEKEEKKIFGGTFSLLSSSFITKTKL